MARPASNTYPRDVTTNGAAPLLVTIEQAGEILGLGRTTIYELVHRGELRAVHIGRAVRFPLTELEQFVEALMAPRPPL